MSDLGGSHSWLIDVGGGAAREEIRSDRRGSVDRPSDDELRLALGATDLHRGALGEAAERVVARLTDGRELQAVLKLGGFWRSRTEGLLYAEALDPATDGSPKLLAQEEGWFLIEDLADARPVALDDRASVEAAYRRLAAIHVAHRGAPAGLSAGLADDLRQAPLTLLAPADVAAALDELGSLVERAAHDPQVWEISTRAAQHVAELRAWARDRGRALADLGATTLLHGDYQRANWLIDASGAARVLDWELAALGPGLLDLYYLQTVEPSVGHAPAGRAALRAIAWYCEQLSQLGVSHPSADLAVAHLSDAIAWGAIAAARLRLGDYYAAEGRSRTPRGELPGAAAGLIRYAAEQIL